LGKTLGEIGLMPLAEYNGWYEYSLIEPWDSHNQGLRADLRAGQICATVANWSGNRLADGAKPRTPANFMSSLSGESQPENQPESVLLDDPAAQSKLIKQILFGIDK
jgi:hypothetical protein